MKKPKYVETLWALIFVCLGIAFMGSSGLCFLGVMKPSRHSAIQDPILLGKVFGVIAMSFVIAAVIVQIFVKQKISLHKEICKNGKKYIGTVEKVYLQKWTKFSGRSPFRICYTYQYQEKIYHRKSVLLWEEPKLEKGNSIEVYVDERGRCALDI